jgi:hypothetical protein
MAFLNQQPHQPAYVSTPNRGNGMSTFLSSVAVLLSTLALICSGYVAYQVINLQKTLDTLNTKRDAAIAPGATVNIPTASNTQQAPVQQTQVPGDVTTQSTPASGVAISPRQFVQKALGKKAEVELLSVKRIKDSDSGSRDIVNVQMRIRRLAGDDVVGRDIINVSGTTARNPETSETYKSVGFQRSTGSVSLFLLRKGASADAYVWLRVPQGVNYIDIFVPETAVFKNVPIS